MDSFLYYIQMALSYALAISQVVMYVCVIAFLVKIGKPAVKALKTYADSKDSCNCGCGCAEAPAVEAAPEVKAE